MKTLKFFTLVVGFCLSANAMAADWQIVGNNDLKKDSISKRQVQDIFVGNVSSWEGTRVSPCVLNTTEGKAFFDQVLGVSEREFNQNWVKKELSGAGIAPKQKASVDDVIDYAASTPGAICFIPKSAAGSVAGKAKLINITD